MEVSKFSIVRDALQQGIYKVINPFVRGLIKVGLTPNMVTTIGLLLNIGVALIFILAAERTNRGDLSYVGWAGALVLFAGVFDMLDGQVARLGNMSSRFGALYDSVLDRYSELILFLGICYYLIAHHYFFSSLFAFIALIGSMMVSYTRARAEGLGIECKGGLMQRPERIVTIGVFGIACGVAGHFMGSDYKLYIPGIPFHVFETMSIFTIPLTVMAVMTNITAINRLMDAKRGLERQELEEKKVRSSKIPVMVIAFVSLSATFMNAVPVYADTVESKNPSPITFPKPKGISNQLFYLQRDPNTNTIIYELNLDGKGLINDEKPIKVYWMRYDDNGEKKELSYVQRKFAYGIRSKKIEKDRFELRFVSYKQLPLYLSKSTTDNKYHVFINANDKNIQLDRIFIRIEGGSLWVPNIKYVDLQGVNTKTKIKISERITL